MKSRKMRLATLLSCATSAICAHAEIMTYSAESEYQNGKQEIRVLAPDTYDPQHKYRVVYVLPVETGFNSRFGYGLGVLQQMDAHNVHDVILVQMGFEKEPWLGNHAQHPKIRQASYLKDFVVPFIEKKYSTVAGPEGRLLLGFSKSGWGAFSLILKHPDFFGYAAAWDAPMMFDGFHFGMKSIFGTQEQLDKCRPDLLAASQAKLFHHKTRLVFAGEKLWGTMKPAPGGGSHTVKFHDLLDKHGLKHFYSNEVAASHRWHKSWLEPTLGALLDLTVKEEK